MNDINGTNQQKIPGRIAVRGVVEIVYGGIYSLLYAFGLLIVGLFALDRDLADVERTIPISTVSFTAYWLLAVLGLLLSAAMLLCGIESFKKPYRYLRLNISVGVSSAATGVSYLLGSYTDGVLHMYEMITLLPLIVVGILIVVLTLPFRGAGPVNDRS